MYLPLHINVNDYEREANILENKFNDRKIVEKTGDVAKKLKILLQEAGVPSIDENLLLQGLLTGNTSFEPEANLSVIAKTQPIDLIQSENDFIDAYNALTRSSPLPNINGKITSSEILNGNSLISQNDLKEKNNAKTKRSNNHKPEPPNIKNEYSHSDKIEQSTEVIQQIIDTPQKIEQIDSNKADSGNELDETIPAQTGSPILNFTNQNNYNENTSQNTGKLPKSLNKSEENISDNRNQRQIEEKSNNLTDIVDNTQRLIQQMKEEINSDINSIDGRTVSQSEAESSTDETNDEQESSYSDTEERTDNLTSDEKEVTSSDDEEPSDKQQVQSITSSEENENFEEALDHVENQLEDFKHANIEMLDSIARTLQEEHTFTVEINNPQTQNDLRAPKKGDVNNNVFVSVNSFEEIYEELSTQNKVDEVVNNKETVKQTAEDNTTPKNLELFAKEAIVVSTVKVVAPIKLVISENIHPIFNAVLENVEQNQNNNSINVQDIKLQQEATPEPVTEEIIQPGLEQAEFDQNNSSENHSAQILLVEEPEQPLSADSENIPIATLNIEVNNKSNKNFVENNLLDLEKTEIANNDKKPILEQFSVDTPSDNNSIKNSIANKSNIPKLIRITPNNKSKNDKNAPKLIVSKVPVRRTSIKQYPAPAPPKSHFGNVQSGHVRQLQTRLFNNKAVPSQPIPTTSEMPQVKATTSTLNKKKPAPPPPLKQKEEKQLSPPKTTLPKEKKPFFRETCRTEDEWTDSDSEDSQLLINKPTEESIHSPPSPPPPVTVRRVSGQIIDLAKVRLPEGSPEVCSVFTSQYNRINAKKEL